MNFDEAEIYPNPPIEFVACEIQFPVTPALGTDDVLPVLHRSLFGWLPLVEPEVQTSILIGAAQQPPIVTKQLRFLSRDRRVSVVVSQVRVSVETTDYPGWAAFRPLVARALEAVEAADPMIPGIARVGLRYIDEVRVPDPAPGTGRWDRFIDPRLGGPAGLELGGRTPSEYIGVLQFDLGDGHHVVARYGVRQGLSVGGTPLRRREQAGGAGEHFLLDIDSYQETPDALPEFTIASVLQEADRLHRPVRALFELSITETLRNEVLRRPPSDG